MIAQLARVSKGWYGLVFQWFPEPISTPHTPERLHGAPTEVYLDALPASVLVTYPLSFALAQFRSMFAPHWTSDIYKSAFYSTPERRVFQHLMPLLLRLTPISWSVIEFSYFELFTTNYDPDGERLAVDRHAAAMLGSWRISVVHVDLQEFDTTRALPERWLMWSEPLTMLHPNQIVVPI